MWYSLRKTQLPAIITNRFSEGHVEAFPAVRAWFAYSNLLFTFFIKEIKRGSAVDLFQSVQVEFNYWLIHFVSKPPAFLLLFTASSHHQPSTASDGEYGCQECGYPAQAVRIAPFPPAPGLCCNLNYRCTEVAIKLRLFLVILRGLSLLRHDQQRDTGHQDQGIGGEAGNVAGGRDLL